MNRIEEEIVRYSKTMPQYRESLDFLRKILKFQSSLADRIIANADEKMPLHPPDSAEADDQLQSGLPLFEKKSVNIPPILFRKAMEELRLLLPQDSARSALDRLLGSELMATENIETMLKELNTDSTSCVNRLAEAAAAGTDILLFLLHTVLSPFFEIQAGFYRELLNSVSWRHGRCPMCGSEPGMARLAADDGRRILACFLCHTEWVFDRLRCPFCEYNGPPIIRHFTVDDDNAHRVDCCDACGRYLKVVDERVMGRPSSLPVEDVITAHLDMLAKEQRYR